MKFHGYLLIFASTAFALPTDMSPDPSAPKKLFERQLCTTVNCNIQNIFPPRQDPSACLRANCGPCQLPKTENGVQNWYCTDKGTKKFPDAQGEGSCGPRLGGAKPGGVCFGNNVKSSEAFNYYGIFGGSGGFKRLIKRIFGFGE